MLEIDLIRHAQSVANTRPDIIHGRMNHSPLSALGFLQCEALDARLQNENQAYDKIYSSTAVRAVQTRKHGLKSQLNEKYATESEQLLELDQGDFVGRNRVEVYTPKTIAEIAKDPWNFKPKNGESQSECGQRMWDFIDERRREYLSNNEGEHYKIAIVTHGLAIKCWIRKLLDFNPQYTWLLETRNTSISRFTYRNLFGNYSWTINKINDAAHIKEN
ncbi:MAG TPA: histidine phosphatase family protein [Acidobacteriota bacterium]|nr:histidine phosphatase family protein [Acidobacteriota bacterium]